MGVGLGGVGVDEGNGLALAVGDGVGLGDGAGLVVGEGVVLGLGDGSGLDDGSELALGDATGLPLGRGVAEAPDDGMAVGLADGLAVGVTLGWKRGTPAGATALPPPPPHDAMTMVDSRHAAPAYPLKRRFAFVIQVSNAGARIVAGAKVFAPGAGGPDSTCKCAQIRARGPSQRPAVRLVGVGWAG